MVIKGGNAAGNTIFNGHGNDICNCVGGGMDDR